MILKGLCIPRQWHTDYTTEIKWRVTYLFTTSGNNITCDVSKYRWENLEKKHHTILLFLSSTNYSKTLNVSVDLSFDLSEHHITHVISSIQRKGVLILVPFSWVKDLKRNSCQLILHSLKNRVADLWVGNLWGSNNSVNVNFSPVGPTGSLYWFFFKFGMWNF